MKAKIVTVYDSKVEGYSNPLSWRSRGEAVRSFQEAVNSPDHQFSKYPMDFSLMEIGEFDEETGRLTAHEKPVSLGLANDFKRPTESLPVRLPPSKSREGASAPEANGSRVN